MSRQTWNNVINNLSTWKNTNKTVWSPIQKLKVLLLKIFNLSSMIREWEKYSLMRLTQKRFKETIEFTHEEQVRIKFFKMIMFKIKQTIKQIESIKVNKKSILTKKTWFLIKNFFLNLCNSKNNLKLILTYWKNRIIKRSIIRWDLE